MRPSAVNDALFKRALLKESPVGVLKLISDRGANYFAIPSCEYQMLEKSSCFIQLCNPTEEIMAMHCWGSLKPGLLISSSSNRQADNILRSLRAGLHWEQPLTDAGDIFLTRKKVLQGAQRQVWLWREERVVSLHISILMSFFSWGLWPEVLETLRVLISLNSRSGFWC